ncbi:MAG: hypothetical protein NTNFB02_28870 [Nitrospira sp.]
MREVFEENMSPPGRCLAPWKQEIALLWLVSSTVRRTKMTAREATQGNRLGVKERGVTGSVELG